MGANAQTTVPTFTAGQVLTADQQNQSARTGVPVFSTTGTRDAAFGGTGEKSLAEGQLCYVEGTGLQSYNGTSWVTWGTAPSSGALVYLTGATFTTATSFSLATSTFTSTYRNYRMIVDITAVTSDSSFTMRMRASGSDNSTSNYYSGFVGTNTSGTSSTYSSNGTTNFVVGEQDPNASYQVYSLTLDIIRPQIAASTQILGQFSYFNTAGTAILIQNGGGTFADTTQFDALTFISSTASSITGQYRVYAYANS